MSSTDEKKNPTGIEYAKIWEIFIYIMVIMMVGELSKCPSFRGVMLHYADNTVRLPSKTMKKKCAVPFLSLSSY